MPHSPRGRRAYGRYTAAGPVTVYRVHPDAERPVDDVLRPHRAPIGAGLVTKTELPPLSGAELRALLHRPPRASTMPGRRRG